MLQLCQGNDDRQAVDEAQHHRVRHHAHQLAQAQQAEGDHDQAAQQYRRQQILHTVLHHQRDDHHRHRAGRTGHHAGPTAEQRGEGADDESAVEPHQRVEVSHQGKGDAFGQQRKRRGEAGQGIGAQTGEVHEVPWVVRWG